jgi:hypothetical protein
MHSTYALLALAPFTATLVSAGCYGSGDSGNKGTANNGIDTVCKAVQGEYKYNQERARCVSNDRDHTYWMFVVKHTGEGGVLDFNECKTRLMNEVWGCADGKGGQSDVGAWFYR